MGVYWLEQTEADVPAENQWLGANETICLSSMRFAKRRDDWRLGRWTAKHAVAAHLGLSTDLHALAKIEILAASSGAPEVFVQGQPADIAISLSHRDRAALCAVGSAGTSIGCDLEIIEPRGDEFLADYFTDNEKSLIARASVGARPLLLTLLWSGKESALKALHAGLRLDTRCMCVTPVDGWAFPSAELAQDRGQLPESTSPEGWRPLQVRYSGGRIFRGWWRLQDGLVRTAVSDPPMESIGKCSSPSHAEACTSA
jgi:4'-phosphopantetheinyl transferase